MTVLLFDDDIILNVQVAMEAYGKAVYYNPQYWEAHHRLGRLLQASDRTVAEWRGTESSERLRKV